MTSLEKSILQTISWFDIFDYPLTDWEVFKYLWSPSASNKNQDKIKYSDIRNTLRNPSPEFSAHVENKNIWHYLAGKSSTILKRHTQHLFFRKRWSKSHQIGKVARSIPHLKTLAMCNTFSLQNSSSQSDLDVFVITAKKRLWLVRSFLWLKILIRKKWRHSSHIASRFCLSFFITEDNLDLSIISQKPYDIYLVYWIALLSPIYGNKATHKFYQANSWISQYLPNWHHKLESSKYTVPDVAPVTFIKKIIENIVFKPINDLLEFLASFLERQYMKRKHAKYPDGYVIVSDKMLKFHNQDRREYFRNEWENKFKNLVKKQ